MGMSNIKISLKIKKQNLIEYKKKYCKMRSNASL